MSVLDARNMTLLDFCNYHDALDLRDYVESKAQKAAEEASKV